MSKFIMVLLTVMCLMPTMAFSFSESDHEKLMKEDYGYQQANDKLNKNWDRIRKDLKGTEFFKIALAEQRRWLNSRSERIDAIVKNGASLAAAATIVTNQQADKLLEFANHDLGDTKRKMSIEDRLALLEFAVQWSGKYTYGEPDGEQFDMDGMTRYPEYGQTVISFLNSEINISVSNSSPRGSSCEFASPCTVIDNILICKAYNDLGDKEYAVVTGYVGIDNSGNKTISIIETPEFGWCGIGAHLDGTYTKRQ